MFLSGPAGTGQSWVFKALCGRNDSSCCSFSWKKKRANQLKEDLKSMWNGVDFLLIDEVSMISCEFLIEISEALSDAKGNSSPFGGVNIIFAGDFAQLPPVLQTQLYVDPKTKYGVGSRKKEKRYWGDYFG